MDLVLSLFSGAGLLDRGFEQAGFCVVSAGDILWGRDVRKFVPARHIFRGVIGGPPCQDFSLARRGIPPTGAGLEMVNEYIRVVLQAQPDWWLMENVVAIPDIIVPGYVVQRIHLNAKECGLPQNRLRAFQFGCRSGKPLVVERLPAVKDAQTCCLATEGAKLDRRGFSHFCELQGLSPDFQLPGLSQNLKYRLVGNGVPVPMARLMAKAIRQWNESGNNWARVCVCGCGRPVRDGQTQAEAQCRKRMQRRRDRAGVTGPGDVTIEESQISLTMQGELGLPV